MNPKTIIKVVCKYYHIEESELFNKSHKPHIVERKHMVRKLLRETRQTLHDIGKLTNCSHDNALHGIRQAQNLIDTEPDFRNDYLAIKTILENTKEGITTLLQLAELWTKRIEFLKTKLPRSHFTIREMEYRMVKIMYWAGRFGIKC